jgi:probable FeS assembly SUF system protein SufT
MSSMRRHTTLSRDVEAAEIPYGGKVTLTSGTVLTVAQALGGTFTVLTPQGYMVRIAGTDADAMGEDFAAEAAKYQQQFSSDKNVQEMAWDQLRTCYDPEIPVNIVDLGLVYECTVSPAEPEGDKVTVRFTLTAPGCGMGDYLREDIKQKLVAIPGVKDTDVQVVLEPVWNQSMMSDAARLQLGLM